MLRTKYLDNQILADAIRKNGVEHIRGRLFQYDENSNIIAACALGQAGRNLGVGTQINNLTRVMAFSWYKCPFPSIYDFMGERPCSTHSDDIGSYIIHLNDSHLFSLDKIADAVLAAPPFKIVLKKGIFA